MEEKNTSHRKSSLNNIRHEVQKAQVILIVSIAILLAAGGALISIHANDKALDQNLQNTAELISRLYVSNQSHGQATITALFDSVRENLSEVDVISIIDENNTRLYHSNHELIGTEYDGTVPDFPHHQHGFYTENDIGPSGPQRRAYCALHDYTGRYRGFIMTIILKTSIRSVTVKIVVLFIIVTLGAVLIELALSKALSRKIKKHLMGYEPDTLTSMFRIRDKILNSISDGIMAVNAESKVEFLNTAARDMLQYDGENTKLNELHLQLFIQKFLTKTLVDGERMQNLHERTENGTELLIDCTPIHDKAGKRGAVAILHDRTEYTNLMEDLSGTKYLVDSMRANNHDFTNKLHVILGLIQIGQYKQAVSYIENISIIQRETISTVMHSIDNPSFAALLIGKIARASECNVRFILREGSSYNSTHITFPSEALITISGNLIENALDSMNQMTGGNTEDVKELVFGVFTKPGSLLITVDDTGSGIPDDLKEKIFENGFSTKGTGRGIGLYHTKQLVESLGGTISFESQIGQGTSFMVSFSKA